jgi:hypothetical protein
MTQEKERLPLLGDDLSQAERILLAQLAHTPGFTVFIKMMNAACLKATQDILKLDPELDGYEKKVSERQRRARFMSEFSDLVFSSINYHIEVLKKQNIEENLQAVEAVSNRFGIHPAKEGESNDAVKKVFGIHSAKPKKQAKS